MLLRSNTYLMGRLIRKIKILKSGKIVSQESEDDEEEEEEEGAEYKPYKKVRTMYTSEINATAKFVINLLCLYKKKGAKGCIILMF